MKRRLILFLVALTPYLAAAQRRTNESLRVQPFYFDDILHTYAAAYSGSSCSYMLANDSLLIFVFSFDSHVGVIMIDGKIVELRQDTAAVHQPQGSLRTLTFKNKRYRLEWTGEEFDAGELIIRQVRTRKMWKRHVTGTCGV